MVMMLMMGINDSHHVGVVVLRKDVSRVCLCGTLRLGAVGTKSDSSFWKANYLEYLLSRQYN